MPEAEHQWLWLDRVLLKIKFNRDRAGQGSQTHLTAKPQVQTVKPLQRKREESQEKMPSESTKTYTHLLLNESGNPTFRVSNLTIPPDLKGQTPFKGV